MASCHSFAEREYCYRTKLSPCSLANVFIFSFLSSKLHWLFSAILPKSALFLSPVFHRLRLLFCGDDHQPIFPRKSCLPLFLILFFPKHNHLHFIYSEMTRSSYLNPKFLRISNGNFGIFWHPKLWSVRLHSQLPSLVSSFRRCQLRYCVRVKWESELLSYLRRGWRVAHKLENGRVIVKR